MTLADDALGYALTLGFDLAATLPLAAPRTGAAYRAWLEAGYHGEMTYMAEREALRLAPQLLAPDARSMIVLIANYARQTLPSTWDEPSHVHPQGASPALRLAQRGAGFGSGTASLGRVAQYAWPNDYHDVLKSKLFHLDEFIRQRTGRESLGKACVDPAPLLERDFAEQAGLGFTGRNTCLITHGLGSWTFIAALLVPEELEAKRASTVNHSVSQPPFMGCGGCTRCRTACPTNALLADYVLDARRCISYLTIELRGPIPRDLRPLMGNWVFGCDVCQAVCPYNRAAPRTTMFGLRARSPVEVEKGAVPVTELLSLDEVRFHARFRGTPILRTKRRGLVRNACVAAGNSNDPSVVPHLIPLLTDSEPLVRGHAAWALGRLGGTAAMAALREALVTETNEPVGDEIDAALGMT